MVDSSLDNVVRIKRRRTYDDALAEQERAKESKMTEQRKYDRMMKKFEAQYGNEGVYAFEACCFTEQQLSKMSEGQIDMRVQHAMQDMGRP